MTQAEPLASPATVAAFQLGGLSCRIVCVDALVPQHQDGPGRTRPRLTYIAGEVGHFELDTHRYALVVENPPPADLGERAVDGKDVAARLSNRELQIVQLICMGLLSKQVADRLHISEFTVRSYLKTIYAKLGVRSRGAMVYTYAQSMARSRADDSG